MKKNTLSLSFFLFALLIAAVAPLRAGDGSVTIPLQFVNIGSPANPEYKLGIYVGLGGGAPKLYEFDTGAAGFFAAYSSPTAGDYTPWWKKFSSTGKPITMSYSSGIQYNATIVNSTVQIYGSETGNPLASLSTQVGQIQTATGSNVSKWDKDLKDGKPPLYGHFYGDFGMALYRNEGNTPVPPIPSPDTNPSLYAILPQLGPRTGLGKGFILRMGGYTNPTPSVQIGFTDDDRKNFTRTAPMNPPNGTTEAPGTFPTGGGPVYSQQLLQGIMSLNVGESTETNQVVGLVMDTGAPSTVIHDYGTITVNKPIDNVTVADPTDGTEVFMQYTTGDLPSFNVVGTSSNKNPLWPTQGYMNTGLNLFFANDVLFDLEKSQVRFASVPNPTAPVTIPLHVVNIGKKEAPIYKLGIYIGLGNGKPKLYEFDTGAPGFFAAYDPPYTPWWGEGSYTPSGRNFKMHYSSGNHYKGRIVSTQISIYASDKKGEQPVASVVTELGQITHADGGVVENWETDLKAGNPPLYGAFYGDFGMALDTKTDTGLYAILPQLGPVTGPVANGFIIHVGDYKNPKPTLQIGLTPTDPSQFTNVIKMNPSAAAQTGVFPNGGGPTYGEQLITGNMLLNGGASVNTLGVTLDTGAPSTVIHAYGTITVPSNINDLQLTGIDDVTTQTDTLMQYRNGSQEGLDNVVAKTKPNSSDPANGYVNTGLNIFFENDIMYNVQAGQLGFLPVPLTQKIDFPAIADKAVGDAPFKAHAKASSSLPVTYDFSGPITLSGDTITVIGAGTVKIRARQAGSSHYLPGASDLVTFKIDKGTQTIDFPAIPDQRVGQTYVLSATASSGFPVSFQLVSGPATLSGKVLTFTGPGAVSVKASQSGNPNYKPAPDVTESIVVK